MATAARSGARRDKNASPPIKLEIVDVEKVRGLSNYYAYVIKVVCKKDDSTCHIYRRYSQFDQMQAALEKRFLIEAGAIKAKDRVLPNLPTKTFFGRSAIREVTEKRLPMLNSYLVSLFSLPDKIRYDSIVSAFTTPTSEDLARPYTGNNAYKAAVKPDRPPIPYGKPVRPHGKPARPVDKPLRPQIPKVVISDSTKPFRPPNLPHTAGKDPPNFSLPTKKGAKGKALYDYAAMHSDELSFQEGDELSLLEQVDGGKWWKASLRGRTGLAPANYVEELSKPVLRDFRDQVQDSDEWETSEEEEEGEDEGNVVYHYNEAARNVSVPMDISSRPNYISLYRAIQKQLHRHDIMLNYKDSDGDLVQITEQSDMVLLTTEAMPTRRQHGKTKHAPWAIYVTLTQDTSVYHSR